MIHLMIVTLLTGMPYYSSNFKDFATKEECFQVRGVLVAQALEQPNVWLISSCEADKEPVVLRVYFKEQVTEPEVKPDA